LIGTTLMRAADPAAKLRELVSRPLVKVCGLTREEDVAAAVEAGADLCGFILVDESPRRAPRVLDVPGEVIAVGVYVGEPGRDGDLQQVYEREEGRVRGRDAVLLRNAKEVAKVVDLPWLEDDPSHLERARSVEGRVMLAGGLGPENVRDAI
jgi:phosphoribosylanthranilate isomerase